MENLLQKTTWGAPDDERTSDRLPEAVRLGIESIQPGVPCAPLGAGLGQSVLHGHVQCRDVRLGFKVLVTFRDKNSGKIILSCQF